MIGTNAGPPQLAGEPATRTTSPPPGRTTRRRGDGQVSAGPGHQDVYLMAPNYAAGKDMVAGFKRYYKGEIVDEVYTRPGQPDYQAELAQLRAASPKACSSSIPAAWASSSSSSTRRPACKRRSRSTRCTPSTSHAAAQKDAGARHSRRAGLDPRPERAEQEVRRRLQEEVQRLPVLLRRAELRRDDADRLGASRR